MGLETNIFPIKNLSELSSDYRLYRIKGLTPDQSEYFQNRQHIKRDLSYKLQKPVTIIDRDSMPYLVVRADSPEPPSPFPLVRTVVVFEPTGEQTRLDYTVRSSENDEVCLRFLQFMVQEPLQSHPWVWQPGAGKPFFEKKAFETTRGLDHFVGWSVRAAVTPGGGLGFCVDVTNKFVSQTPMPSRLTRDEFPQWKNKHYIYHYGHRWYEIQVVALSDLNVNEYQVKKDTRWVNLPTFIAEESKKPTPPELAQLPDDAAVVIYQNNRGEDRAAPAPLCYLVQGTDNEEAGDLHDRTILPAYKRERLIRTFVRQHLSSLRFGNMLVRVSSDPVAVPNQNFLVPDLQFGKELLSVRGTPGARHTSLEDLGSARLALLKEVGFHVADPLDRQYLVLPQSVAESYGDRFVKDLQRHVDELFPQDEGYNPVLVRYDDRVPKTVPRQGAAIIQAVRDACEKPGYAVVMIHRTIDQRFRKEDQLAGLVVRELRKQRMAASVIHSTVSQNSYRLVRDSEGNPHYAVAPEFRGKLNGYLRGVAINKVLLTNQRWPFVLGTRLHADLTIGIDVKQKTAGLVVVGASGGEIRALLRTSSQKEKLDEDSLKAYLVEIVRQEAEHRSEPIKTIVLHRDGEIYPPELAASHQAMMLLRGDGSIVRDATCTVIEIPKSSPVPARLFDVSERDAGRWVENPQVGSYFLINDSEAYLCSTGRAFRHAGTVHPLHVRHVEGPLPFIQCLEDIYYLTTLAWTRPEDCTRYPITIKLNDRFLAEEATAYDEDALEAVMALENEAGNE